jgi:tetratricopeptide (TPR) repeat protein
VGKTPAESHFALAILRNEEGDSRSAKAHFEKAAADFAKLTRKDPQNPERYNRESGAWYFLGKYDKAVDLLEKAIRLKPDYADAWVGIGANRIEMGQMAKAKEALLKAKELFRQQGNSAGVEEAGEHLRKIP